MNFRFLFFLFWVFFFSSTSLRLEFLAISFLGHPFLPISVLPKELGIGWSQLRMEVIVIIIFFLFFFLKFLFFQFNIPKNQGYSTNSAVNSFYFCYLTPPAPFTLLTPTNGKTGVVYNNFTFGWNPSNTTVRN